MTLLAILAVTLVSLLTDTSAHPEYNAAIIPALLAFLGLGAAGGAAAGAAGAGAGAAAGAAGAGAAGAGAAGAAGAGAAGAAGTAAGAAGAAGSVIPGGLTGVGAGGAAPAVITPSTASITPAAIGNIVPTAGTPAATAGGGGGILESLQGIGRTAIENIRSIPGDPNKQKALLSIIQAAQAHKDEGPMQFISPVSTGGQLSRPPVAGDEGLGALMNAISRGGGSRGRGFDF